jgi:MFS family permease
MGTLGDRIGRRKLLLAGAAAFAVASAIAAFARSAEMLIAMRAALGIAVATAAALPAHLTHLSEALRRATGAALTDALQFSTVAGVMIVLVAGVTAARILRGAAR